MATKRTAIFFIASLIVFIGFGKFLFASCNLESFFEPVYQSAFLFTGSGMAQSKKYEDEQFVWTPAVSTYFKHDSWAPHLTLLSILLG